MKNLIAKDIKMISRLAGLTLVVLFGMASVGKAASFDCNNATTETEMAICGDPELSALDEEMAESWMRLVGQVQKSNQFQWLIERDACRTKKCLVSVIEERIDYLSMSLKGASKRFKCRVSDKEFSVYNEPDTGKHFVIIRGMSYAGSKDRKKVVDALASTAGSGICKFTIWTFEYQSYPMMLDSWHQDGCSGEHTPPELGTLRIVEDIDNPFGRKKIEFLCEPSLVHQ